ncbi:MAG: hypothetical protein ABS84_07160 [Rubrivivax sp. SCN 71-131]|jgi:hypothetical protein|nr:MAG: hypothetical protein ABS84_07160 [Rubrivivax sp. SCN 71-131]
MHLALAWWRRRAGAARWPHDRGLCTVATAPPAPAAPHEEPGACGWFDSSHELLAGLAVIEHRDVPLDFAVQALLGLDGPAPCRAAPRQARRPSR